VFNAIPRRQYFPSARKEDRVVSILKPGKDSTLPSSYRLISLINSVGKLFEINLLIKILEKKYVRGRLRD
jgi:hypothetical protein